MESWDGGAKSEVYSFGGGQKAEGACEKGVFEAWCCWRVGFLGGDLLVLVGLAGGCLLNGVEQLLQEGVSIGADY